jgi:hypothetical protein
VWVVEASWAVNKLLWLLVDKSLSSDAFLTTRGPPYDDAAWAQPAVTLPPKALIATNRRDVAQFG